ncbi:Snare region anchored in the vesicle membrane C-terminus family protein [Cryptosporidium felis]|nr:Snare region anchored in the vesicle membrane C-terminus family protein [Cryptosporidium felis]
MASDEPNSDKLPGCWENKLLSEYFQEMQSLIQELSQGMDEIAGNQAGLSKQAYGKYQALLISAQRMLEIIYFEIHVNESKTSHYQSFQTYLKHKDELLHLNDFFSKLKPPRESDSHCTFHESALPVGLLHGPASNGQGKNLRMESKRNYLVQGERLLEETNRYSQQILLNLNTQREQLTGTENRINAISKTLQDSTHILDKMTKWWHKIV